MRRRSFASSNGWPRKKNSTATDQGIVMTDEPLEWCVIDENFADILAPLVRREQAAVRKWRWLAGAAFVGAALLLVGTTWQMLECLWMRDALEESVRDSTSAAKVIETAIPDLEKLRDEQKRDLHAGDTVRQQVKREMEVQPHRGWQGKQLLAAMAREREEAANKKRLLEMGPKDWRDQAHALQPRVCPSMGSNRLPPPVMEPDDDMPEESMPKPGCPLEP
jgi:hypothetical protein